MSRIRNDLPKYRSQILKYDLLIYAAQEREEDFLLPHAGHFMLSELRIELLLK
jgi:hypothetical protein